MSDTIFGTKGFVEGGVIKNRRNENLDIEAMPAIVRTLLVTDGTVTKTLEAYFWEFMVVEPQDQHLVKIEEDLEDLECSVGQELLKRSVRIYGQRSGDVYAYATSLLNLSLLPTAISEELRAGKLGIGELLREKGLETYRQVVDIYKEIQQEVGSITYSDYKGELICRTYYIYLNKRPVMQVTEKFPARLYQKKTSY